MSIRKVVAVLGYVGGNSEGISTAPHAFCNDGTVWFYSWSREQWEKSGIPPVPGTQADSSGLEDDGVKFGKGREWTPK